jgi:hypothetical protein
MTDFKERLRPPRRTECTGYHCTGYLLNMSWKFDGDLLFANKNGLGSGSR